MGKDNRLDKDSVQDLIDSLEMAEQITRDLQRRWTFRALGRLDSLRERDDQAHETLGKLDTLYGR